MTVDDPVVPATLHYNGAPEDGIVRIVDSHGHLFTPAMMAHMAAMPAMLCELRLDVDAARQRLSPADLRNSAVVNGVSDCVLLPSGTASKVARIFDIHVAAAGGTVHTLGTLHPDMSGLRVELARQLAAGARGFKLSSFSQGFDPVGEGAMAMLGTLERRVPRPVVVVDTYTRAHVHFGADPACVTTPARLATLVERFDGITFVGAHMGGLAAPFEELSAQLPPHPNLWLDTSNALHVLNAEQFECLLMAHGPDRVMFGTDWPWFGHAEEIPFVMRRLGGCGLSGDEIGRVMGGNAVELYDL
jgi:uncharacterized protein